MIKMKEKHLTEIWEICISRIYDKDSYVKKLDEILTQEKVKRIIDPACGTGFPSLQLYKLGYDITCSDGNELMLQYFNKNVNGKVKAKRLEWRDLARTYEDEFDAVLVRGNSLIYATSWDKEEINPEESKDAIFKSLENFYHILRENGLLYLDLYKENEQPHKQDLGEVILNNNDRENWKWEIQHDWSKRIRTWSIVRTNLVNKEQVKHISYSYLIKHDELLDMLDDIGFSNVEKISLEEEPNYTVYLARK